jgi:opacity protein-like surface antigen
MMAELGLSRWITDRLALEAALVLRGIQGDERVANQTSTSSGSLAAGLALGAKWILPLSLKNQLYFTFGAGLGPFAGVHGTTVKTSGAPTQETSTAVWAPGGRVRLGLEYYPTAHLMLGLGASYHQIGRFKRFVGARRDFSGLDAAATFGYGWGR